MHITEHHVRRFRNLADLEWSPSSGVNLIVGENGQGKTNLLESIHVGLLGRSFRTRREDECLPWREIATNDEPTRVDISLQTRFIERRLRVVLGRGFKSAFADGNLLKNLGELWATAAVVTFSPADVDLFRDAPSNRRRLLDLLLCQSQRIYMEELQRYQTALKQVNAILRQSRDPAASRAQAEAFYAILAKSGAELMAMRAKYLDALGPLCSKLYEDFGGSDRFDILYAPDLKAGHDTMQSDFSNEHEESVRLNMLSIGPHRDDFRARLANHDLGKYGSQGQHRLAALAFKIASAQLLESDREDPPILLLDDFGSELDVRRRDAVLRVVRGRMQTFITTTQLSGLGPPTNFDTVRTVHAGSWI